MKKKIFAALLVGVMAISVGACGKSKEQEVAEQMYQDLGFEQRDAEELAEAVYGEGGLMDELSDDMKEETKKETKEKSEDDSFTVDPEVASAPVEAGLFQVDDMVFRLDGSMTMDEAVEVVESSSIDNFRITYSPDSTLYGGRTISVHVKKPGGYSFSLDCVNPNEIIDNIGIIDPDKQKELNAKAEEGVMEAKDCTLYGISIDVFGGYQYWIPGGFEITGDYTRDDLLSYLETSGYKYDESLERNIHLFTEKVYKAPEDDVKITFFWSPEKDYNGLYGGVEFVAKPNKRDKTKMKLSYSRSRIVGKADDK